MYYKTKISYQFKSTIYFISSLEALVEYYLCSMGPKKISKTLSKRNEFAEKLNLNLKEENSSHFYSWGLQRTVVKKFVQ